jgi:hypothetical protein
VYILSLTGNPKTWSLLQFWTNRSNVNYTISATRTRCTHVSWLQRMSKRNLTPLTTNCTVHFVFIVQTRNAFRCHWNAGRFNAKANAETSFSTSWTVPTQYWENQWNIVKFNKSSEFSQCLNVFHLSSRPWEKRSITKINVYKRRTIKISSKKSVNKKVWEELMAYFPFTRHEPHTKRGLQQLSLPRERLYRHLTTIGYTDRPTDTCFQQFYCCVYSLPRERVYRAVA